jgi:hypothetical protein
LKHYVSVVTSWYVPGAYRLFEKNEVVMPVVEAPRDERVNLRLSSSASEDVRWLAEMLGVPKTVATALAVAVGVKTLQRYMAITPAEVEQLLAASGNRVFDAVREMQQDAMLQPGPAPARPAPARPTRQQPAIKGKKRH